MLLLFVQPVRRVGSENPFGNFGIYEVYDIDRLADAEVYRQARQRVGVSCTHSLLGLQELDGFPEGDPSRFIQICAQPGCKVIRGGLRAREFNGPALVHEELQCGRQGDLDGATVDLAVALKGMAMGIMHLGVFLFAHPRMKPPRRVRTLKFGNRKLIAYR